METAKDEKLIILDALRHFYNAIDNSCRVITDEAKNELRVYQQKVDNVWSKVILETHTIEVYENNQMVKLACMLCGHTFRPDIPNWAFLNGPRVNGYYGAICGTCLKKHAPDLDKEMTEKNKAYWEKEKKEETANRMAWEAENNNIKPVDVDNDLPF